MAGFFLDSSALVKRYAVERGSSWVGNLTNPAANHDLLVVSITGVEVVSALVRKTPPLPAPDLAQALADFQQDFFVQYQHLDVTEAVVAQAMRLAERHRLRGYDAVQLGAAVELLASVTVAGAPGFTFVSADSRLNAAAAAEGLAVDDPNQHP